MQLPLLRGRSVHASCSARWLPRGAYCLPAAAISLASLSAAQTVDGTIVGDGYPRLAVQACNTTFGDNVNELNGGYGKIVGGKLYLAFPGNIGGTNIDKLDIFLDVKSGGENTLSGTLTMDGANAMSGLQFDSGFEADFLVICRQNTSNSQFDVDLGNVVTGSSDAFADVFSGSTEGSATATIGSPSILSNGIDIAYDDSNTAGVDGTGPSAAARADAAAVQTGVELGITLSDLGYTTGDDIRVCAFINNVTHTFISNQVLGPLPSHYGNMATASSVNFGNEAGDQFFTVSTDTPVLEALPEDLNGSFAQAELLELGDMDGDGDLDTVAYSGSTGEIVYFANNAGTWGAATSIATQNGTTQMQLVDVTGDGDLDVAAISPTSQTLVYYENPQIGGGGWVANDVAGGGATQSISASAQGFAAADFDDEGDTMDFVVADSPGVFLIEDASGAGTEISGFPAFALGPQRVVAGDFDSTGGPDVVMSATYSNGSIVGIMNTGVGSASFANAFRIKGDLTGAKEMAVTNFDGLHGDDLILCSDGLGKAELFKSNGSGLNTFPTGSISGLSGALDVAFSDVDADSDLDVIVAEAGTSTLSWYPNVVGSLSITPLDTSAISGSTPSAAGGDINGDGDGDVVVGGATKVETYSSTVFLGFSVACTQPGGAILASGSTVVDSNDITLNLTGAEASQLGYFVNSFLGGSSPGAAITPGAPVSGSICIGGSGVIYGRHSGADQIFTTDGSGAASLTIDANDLQNPRNGIAWPNPGNNTTAILAGETFYWQAWYRITGGSEFSDAIGITFR